MKQAIVVRKDLKMSCGKLAGQVAHASVRSFIKIANLDWEDHIKLWFRNGETKIVLKVQSESELDDLITKCENQGVVYVDVHDLGKTQLEPHTLTAIGIGPYLDEIIDKIVGGLKLL